MTTGVKVAATIVVLVGASCVIGLAWLATKIPVTPAPASE